MASEVRDDHAVACLDGELGIEDLYHQVIGRLAIENAVTGRRGSSARRIVGAIWELIHVRAEKHLRPYPATAITGVVWLMVRNH